MWDREQRTRICAAAGLCLLFSCNGQGESSAEPSRSAGGAPDVAALASDSAALAPLPQQMEGLDLCRVALGRRLFQDRRLSGDGLVACQDCHQRALGGANGQRTSSLPNRPPVLVNVPSIYNLAFDFRYAWNGRFETLEAQIDFALTTPAAMNASWAMVVAALARDFVLQRAFGDAYEVGLNAHTVRDALVAYMRSLVTPNARFDRFLRGELALSLEEQRGYERFRDYGCISCHQGINVGGNLYQRLGVMREYFGEPGSLQPADLGRYAATQVEHDRHVFRVPSLRNVALTAPYFHDGSRASLRDAIAAMARYQLGRELSDADRDDIAAFLRSLTGELEGQPL